MGKKLLSLIILFLAGISAVYAYDFSAVAPSGQTLYYSINSSGTTVTVTYPYYNYGWNGYTTPSGSITIPSSVTNSGTSYTVTAVGDYSFENCTDITSVSIPNTVTAIGNYAFNGCTGITGVSIGNSVSTIGAWAFEGCTSLSSVNLPNSVTSIGSNAFLGNTSLQFITIPASVTSIGQYAFASSGLTTINFNATNCTNMGTSSSSVFNNCMYVTTINIGSNVTRIPSNAFKGCSNVTSITIPDSVANIGTEAFSNCTGLTTINFNATNCISYGSYTFSGCTNVNTVNIGSNVTRIPASAFSGLTLVNNITVPASVSFVGDYAFDGCTSLTTVNYNADSCITMNGGYVFRNCSNFQNLNIGSNVHYIPANAFYNCRAVTSVVIPDSVTTIGASAFYGCQGLTSVTIGKRVHSILNDAFYNCTTLANTHYSGTLTQWCDIDFYNASSNPVTYSGNLYINNQPMIDMVIPDSVTAIRNYSFYGCSDLNSVVIPNTVTTIHQYPFYYCDHMTSITLGSALTSIGYYAFYGCSAVNSITSLATIAPSLGANCFSSPSILYQSDVFIPCGSTSSYRSRWVNNTVLYTELAGPSFAVYTADSTMGNVNILVHPSCTTQTASFVAAPLLGYRFDHWSDGITDNPRTLTVTQDTLLAAFFMLDDIPHDTVYVYLHDTITVGEPLDFYDLSVNSVQSTGIAVGSGHFSEGTVVEIAAIPVAGNHFVQWSDGNTENPRHVTVDRDITLTAMFDVDQVGVSDVPAPNGYATVHDNVITVHGVAGQRVRIFDAVGRLLSTEMNARETQHFRMMSAGVYLVQVGDGAAQRVVVR